MALRKHLRHRNKLSTIGVTANTGEFSGEVAWPLMTHSGHYNFADALKVRRIEFMESLFLRVLSIAAGCTYDLPMVSP
jgi:hypothetical protein